MFDIQGRYATAICYATVVEEEAIRQIQRMCDHAFTAGSTIRIMPDVHAGVGCTIGTTMTITDKVVPNIVGVDIGCGMYTVSLGRRDIDLARMDEAAHALPSGFHVWDRKAEDFDLTALRCYDALKDVPRLERSLGTLGGGNHFIEIDEALDGGKYLVIHSGSRNLGMQVANHYQKLAVALHTGMAEFSAAQDALIRTFKEQGRCRELRKELLALKKAFKEKEPALPADLCYLYGEPMADYLHDVEICQRFARRSREKMAELILQQLGVEAESAFHTIHNYINVEEMILRKGAIAAHEGELVLIPINMRDGSVLARGRGNPAWNCSAPHGAGRLMSRAQARASFNLEAYRQTMAGVYTTSVNECTLDEAPMAYKSLKDILDVIRDTVDVLEVLRPIYNFKASD